MVKKSGSLKRNPEDNAYDLSEEAEEVSDCSSSKNPATSVRITYKEGPHYNLEIVSRIFCLFIITNTMHTLGVDKITLFKTF